jgi:hypothetical protein
MIELSVVTGTYNRLPILQQMVASVRQSILVGISYEIVLVDGGSTDGTIEWCKAQPDVVLIEQGELLGAIKAFNAGAYAAKGRYVVLANDDIEFINESLTIALRKMQDDPLLGCGCFYQDRPPRGPWHVETMTIRYDRKWVHAPYGQVAIFPKWLGDELGWWGNWGGRTYGGDNEISAQIYTHGYRVAPLDCCCIHDLKADDNLREINEKGSRDGQIWGSMWQAKGGIQVSTTPYKPNPLQRLTRFLYAPIYEPGHPVAKEQKRGLREALARVGVVVEYDYAGVAAERGGQYMRNEFLDYCDMWVPDVILMQCHSPDPDRGFTADHIFQIKQENRQAHLINWNGDYHPEDLFSHENLRMAQQFDIQAVVTTQVSDMYRKNHIQWRYWQNGWEDDSAGIPTDSTPRHDVVFLANGYSRNRQRLARWLRGLPYNVGLYGSWPAEFNPDGYTLYNFDAGARIYRGARISIGDDQWRAPGFVSNRLFQAMHAGGALYMQQAVPGLAELLGLQDGVHFVQWVDLNDLQTKMAYYLEHEAERARIAEAGVRVMEERHSFDQRVAEMLSWLGG